MPILREHEEGVKGAFANITNSGKSRYGGACEAAAFLKSFVEKDTKWAHLDVAGPVHYLSKPPAPYNLGGTGFSAQTLLNLLRKP